jgi:mono/diheme cytochrome c family protein
MNRSFRNIFFRGMVLNKIGVKYFSRFSIFFCILFLMNECKDVKSQASENSSTVPESQSKPYLATAKAIEEGTDLFMVYCSICHGEDGKAKIPQGKAVKARNLVSGKFKKGTSVYGIFKTITDGIPGTQMAGGLVVDEIERWKIAHFVRSIKLKKTELSKTELEELESRYQAGEKISEKKAPPKPQIYPYRLKDLIESYTKSGGTLSEWPSGLIAKIAKGAKERLDKINTRNPEGAYLYRVDCMSCHGTYGEGRKYKFLGVNPSFNMQTIPFRRFRGFGSLSELKTSLENGNRAMIKPSFNHIPDQGMKNLQKYIRSLQYIPKEKTSKD